MLFISSKELFLFIKYLDFCPDFFCHVKRRLDIKAKVNFKINLETDSYNTYCPIF